MKDGEKGTGHEDPNSKEFFTNEGETSEIDLNNDGIETDPKEKTEGTQAKGKEDPEGEKDPKDEKKDPEAKEKLWGGKFKTPEEMEADYNKVTGGDLARVAGERNRALEDNERLRTELQSSEGKNKPEPIPEDSVALGEKFVDDFSKDPIGTIDKAIAAGVAKAIAKHGDRLGIIETKSDTKDFGDSLKDLKARFPDEFKSPEFLTAIRDRYEENHELLADPKALEKMVLELVGSRTEQTRGVEAEKNRKKGRKEAEDGIKNEEAATLLGDATSPGGEKGKELSVEDKEGNDIVNAGGHTFENMPL